MKAIGHKFITLIKLHGDNCFVFLIRATNFQINCIILQKDN